MSRKSVHNYPRNHAVRPNDRPVQTNLGPNSSRNLRGDSLLSWRIYFPFSRCFLVCSLWLVPRVTNRPQSVCFTDFAPSSDRDQISTLVNKINKHVDSGSLKGLTNAVCRSYCSPLAVRSGNSFFSFSVLLQQPKICNYFVKYVSYVCRRLALMSYLFSDAMTPNRRFLLAQRCATRYTLWSCICMSVRLSQIWVLSKGFNGYGFGIDAIFGLPSVL